MISQDKFELLSKLQPGRPGGLTPKEFLQLCLKELGPIEFGSSSALTQAVADNANNWKDSLQFILNPIQISIGDQLPYTTVPGNQSPMDYIFYTWAKNPASGGADRAVLGDNASFRWNDAFTPSLAGIALGLSDTMTQTDSATCGYAASGSSEVILITGASFAGVLNDTETNNWSDVENDNYQLKLILGDNITPGLQDSAVSNYLQLQLGDNPPAFSLVQMQVVPFTNTRTIEVELAQIPQVGNVVIGFVLLLDNNWTSPQVSYTGATVLQKDFGFLGLDSPDAVYGTRCYLLTSTLRATGNSLRLSAAAKATDNNTDAVVILAEYAGVYPAGYSVLVSGGSVFEGTNIPTAPNAIAAQLVFASQAFVPPWNGVMHLSMIVNSQGNYNASIFQQKFGNVPNLGAHNSTGGTLRANVNWNGNSFAVIDAYDEFQENPFGGFWVPAGYIVSPKPGIVIALDYYFGLAENQQGPDNDLTYVLAPSQAFLDDNILNLNDGLVAWFQDSVNPQGEAIVLTGQSAQYGMLANDQISFNDVLAIGYGLQLFDDNSSDWQDTFAFTLSTGGQLTELLSDTLTLTDALAIGYGQGQVDALSFSDSSSLGFGDQISDTLTLSDSEATIFGLLKTFSDQLVLSDSETIGYGNAEVDQLIFSDTSNVGYGDQIAETLVLSDSTKLLFGVNSAFSETLTITDSNVLGYGFAINDSESLSDSFTSAFIGAFVLSVSDQLVLSDSFADKLLVVIAAQLGEFMNAVGKEGVPPLVYGGNFDECYFYAENLAAYRDEVSLELRTPASGTSVFLLNANDAIPALFNFGLTGPVTGDIYNLTTVNIDGTVRTFDIVALPELWSDEQVGQLLVPQSESLSDQLVLSDSEAIGYGNATVDSLIFLDSNAVGYGDVISDQLVQSDTFASLFSIAETLSDTLVFSDSETIGYGNATVDSLTFLDASSVGYGDIISDTLTQTDSERNVLGINEPFSDQLVFSDSTVETLSIAETFADTLVLSDSDAAGYGNAVTDQLVLSDSETLGYGQGTLDALTFSDTSAVGYGDLISDSFTLTDSFAFNSGASLITEQLSDTLILSDSDAIGYGQGQVDSLTFSDSAATGYGSVITDSIALSDSEGNVLGMLSTFSDQLTLSDSYVDLLAGAVVLSDTLTITDSEAIGYGNQMVEQLLFLESQTVGFGDLISDSLNSWLDQFQFNAGQPSISLQFSDQIALSEAMGAGYGNQVSEQNTLSDVMSLMESFEVLLAEASPQMVEALATFMTQAMSAEDTIAFLNDTYSAIGAYLAGLSDLNTLTDQFGDTFAAQLSLLLQDDEGAEWLDAILAEFVFAPGVIRMQALVILQELVGEIKVGGQ